MKSLTALNNADFQEEGRPVQEEGRPEGFALQSGSQFVSVHLLSRDAGPTAGWRPVTLHSVED